MQLKTSLGRNKTAQVSMPVRALVRTSLVSIFCYKNSHLLKQSIRLQVTFSRQQWSSLTLILLRNILGDGSALEQDESIVLQGWNLAEWLHLHVLLRFVLAFGEIDRDELVWDSLLIERGEYTLRASRTLYAMNFEDHFRCCA